MAQLANLRAELCKMLGRRTVWEMPKDPIPELGIGLYMQVLERPLQTICIRLFQFVNAAVKFTQLACHPHPNSRSRPPQGETAICCAPKPIG
jgi:hypothetical protein